MSTTAMWLLLAVVVIVIVFASVLYKRTFTVHELALTGVMAALVPSVWLWPTSWPVTRAMPSPPSS